MTTLKSILAIIVLISSIKTFAEEIKFSANTSEAQVFEKLCQGKNQVKSFDEYVLDCKNGNIFDIDYDNNGNTIATK